MPFPVRPLILTAAGVALLGASACAPLRGHQGYVIDADLVNSIQPGVDTRQSVLAVLGRPTLTSQYSQGEWYYLARDTRNYAFNNPSAKSQVTLRVKFDAAGTVTGIDKTGAELIASIDPEGDKTPTLGRNRSFFEDLFGNIGTVGAPGAGPSGGGPNQ
jgi:outer membrane protein assembly factor BamE (lipoprotein component of BamABCDE complex)